MVPWDRKTKAIPGSSQAIHVKTKMQPKLLETMLCTAEQETPQQATGIGLEQLRNLAQLSEFEVKRGGINIS